MAVEVSHELPCPAAVPQYAAMYAHTSQQMVACQCQAGVQFVPYLGEVFLGETWHPAKRWHRPIDEAAIMSHQPQTHTHRQCCTKANTTHTYLLRPSFSAIQESAHQSNFVCFLLLAGSNIQDEATQDSGCNLAESGTLHTYLQSPSRLTSLHAATPVYMQAAHLPGRPAT